LAQLPAAIFIFRASSLPCQAMCLWVIYDL